MIGMLNCSDTSVYTIPETSSTTFTGHMSSSTHPSEAATTGSTSTRTGSSGGNMPTIVFLVAPIIIIMLALVGIIVVMAICKLT